MSDYTDARTQPGQKVGGADDDRELFMRNFTDYALEAWEQTFDFGDGMTFVKNISAGKSEVFPIIGRKRNAIEHIPGEEIKGGGMEHAEVEIALDAILVESAFIAEIDEMLVHYPLSQPYARQIGESLASETNDRVGRALINASRVAAAQYVGGPVPGYSYHANMATDPAKLEDAAYAGVLYIRQNDTGGGKPVFWMPHQQHLLLARYTGIDAEVTTGSGNRAAGTVGQIGGIQPKGTNSVPNTNIATGRAKYQGDFTPTVGVIANGMAVGTLRRRGLRINMETQGNRLGTLMIGSKFEGHGTLRPECSFEVRTTVRA
ncbi:hypothetical protein [Mesorhizobium sp. M0767]|uniref:hypothetical protein n=1 Tax=Mesorhizobium sp. M0767 TaxID=2956995 RepID=UPI00333C4F6D